MKLSNSLLALWRDFEERLNETFMKEKLSEMTRILLEQKEYDLALHQCLDRQLMAHFQPIYKFSFDSFEEVVSMLSGMQTPHCSYLLEALVDRHMCEYERILSSDPLLTCHCSLPSILAILNSLVFLLRLLFLNDGLQWIVFNVSTLVYVISRRLMGLDLCHLVVEQLKWCVDWTELKTYQNMPSDQLTCLPDQAIVTIVPPGREVEVIDLEKFMWRMQLVLAVVHCYYQCCKDACAENWARRMVVELARVRQRVQEAHQVKDKCALQRPAEEAVLVGNVPRASSSAVCGSVLVQEGMCSELEETKQRLLCCIKKHSLKFSMMIFKRAVLECRRRPQEYLPLENNFHANHTTKGSWMHSQTEQLLDVLFDGGAAQFLALLCFLHSPCRQSLLSVYKSPADETEVLDVYQEVFKAAETLLSGGGGDKTKGVAGVLTNESGMLAGLVDGTEDMFYMALQGCNGVCVREAVEFVMLAYNYNNRSVTNLLLNKLIHVLERHQVGCDGLLQLKVLKLVDRLTMMKGLKHDIFSDPIIYAGIECDLLELLECVEELQREDTSHVMVLDSVMLVWKKVHCFLQSPLFLSTLVLPAPSEDCMVKRVLKLMQQQPCMFKWMDVMEGVRRVLGGCMGGAWMGVHAAEAVVHNNVLLALLYEGMSLYMPEQGGLLGLTHNFQCANDRAVCWLERAQRCLQEALRHIEALHDSLACNLSSYAAHLDRFLAVPSCVVREEEEECVEKQMSMLQQAEPVVTALLLRCLLKLKFLKQDGEDDKKKNKCVSDELEVLQGNNRMTQALKVAVEALVVNEGCCTPGSFECAMQLLCHMANDESTFLRCHNISSPCPSLCPSECLSYPLLLHKTRHTLIFKPPSFPHPCLAFFKIFGCLATAAKRNKANILDTELDGCGILVSVSSEPTFKITKLKAAQKYVFACAAYDLRGDLIGRVGMSTKPILTSNPASFDVASRIIQRYCGRM